MKNKEDSHMNAVGDLSFRGLMLLNKRMGNVLKHHEFEVGKVCALEMLAKNQGVCYDELRTWDASTDGSTYSELTGEAAKLCGLEHGFEQWNHLQTRVVNPVYQRYFKVGQRLRNAIMKGGN